MNCPNCGRALETGAAFCPSCGTKITSSTSDSAPEARLPSAAFAADRKVMSTKAKLIYGVIGSLLIVAMGVVFVRSLPGGEHPVVRNQPVVVQSVDYAGTKLTMIPVHCRVNNGYIVIALSDVVEKRMVGFTYQGKTKSVDLLAYINPQGKVVTSIAMCEPCNSKSFHTESQEIVCDNCGTRWNFTTLEGISGSCQKYPPDPIPSQVVGNEVRISERLVENWKMRI